MTPAGSLVAVRYDRVSKDEGTPAEHLAGLRALAEGRGYVVPPGLEFFDYVTGDPVRRGKDPPGLRRALDEVAKLGKRGVLVIREAGRLVRSPIELLQMVARVQQTGGYVVSRDDGADLDTTTDMGELLVFIRGWFSRMQLRFVRKMTTGALQDRRQQIAGRGGFVSRSGVWRTNLGRPPKVPPAAVARAAELRRPVSTRDGSATMSWEAIAAALKREGFGEFKRGTVQSAVADAVGKGGVADGS